MEEKIEGIEPSPEFDFSSSQPEGNGDKMVRNERGRFVEGHPPLPNAGRPAGRVSLMTEIKKRLQEHPEIVAELVEDYLFNPQHRQLLLQMIDGRPRQDVTSDGEKLPTPILNVFNNNGNKEGGGAEEAH